VPGEWKVSIIYLFLRRRIKDCSNYTGTPLLLTTYKILSIMLLSKLTSHEEEIIGIVSVDFDATGQLLIIYSAFVIYLKKKMAINRSCASSFY